jgi:hypothetical protein
MSTVAVIRRCDREQCQVTFRVASERSRRVFCSTRCQVRQWRLEHPGPAGPRTSTRRPRMGDTPECGVCADMGAVELPELLPCPACRPVENAAERAACGLPAEPSGQDHPDGPV